MHGREEEAGSCVGHRRTFLGGSCPPAYVAEKDNVEQGKERNVNSISRRKGNNVPPDR